jgi:hypothetical protein
MKCIESFVKRRGNVQTIILKCVHAANTRVFSDIHRRLQQGFSFQLSQKQGITVQWHVSADSIAQLALLMKVDVSKDRVGASDSSAGGAVRQYLHTLDLRDTEVSDVTAIASCQSLHTLDLRDTEVSDVSALASCQNLKDLNLSDTQVSDVSALASCQSLRMLDLWATRVSDVSALASCQSLHTLDLSSTCVSEVCLRLHRAGLCTRWISAQLV